MSDTGEGSIAADTAVPADAANAAVGDEAVIDASSATESTKTKAADSPETVEDRKFAAKFAALSRRERQIKAQERSIEARMKQLEAASAPKTTPKVEEVPLENRLKRNPLETLKELGISYEKLTQIALNDGKLTPDLEMSLMKEDMQKSSKSEIEELKAQLEADRKERKEANEKAARDQEERAISNYKEQISNHITVKSGELELLSAEGGEAASEMVFDLINKHYQATIDDETGQGEVMEIEKAAGLVEDYLYEEAKKRIGLNKIKKLLEASTSQQTTPTNKQGSSNKPSVTLSNNNSQVQSTNKRFLSDEESKREVSKLLVWKNE